MKNIDYHAIKHMLPSIIKNSGDLVNLVLSNCDLLEFEICVPSDITRKQWMELTEFAIETNNHQILDFIVDNCDSSGPFTVFLKYEKWDLLYRSKFVPRRGQIIRKVMHYMLVDDEGSYPLIKKMISRGVPLVVYNEISEYTLESPPEQVQNIKRFLKYLDLGGVYKSMSVPSLIGILTLYEDILPEYIPSEVIDYVVMSATEAKLDGSSTISISTLRAIRRLTDEEY